MMFNSINPHDPSEVVGEFEKAGSNEIEAAVAQARRAYFEWREESIVARGDALVRIADDMEKWTEGLVRLIVKEVGKPISEARAEVAETVSILRYYARLVSAPDGDSYPAIQSKDWFVVRRYPLGVCAVITSWNFPLMIPVREVASALVYGNSVLLKPAPASTVIAGTLGTIVASHLPEGTFALVPGDGETGEVLVERPDVAAVFFTGSTAVGRIVASQAVSRGAKVKCEMGGPNSSIVLSDADLDRSAKTIAYAAMGYAGQKSTATSRVVVESSVYGELRERLVSAVESLEVSNPENDSCQIGPLIGEEAREEALRALDRTDGRILTGGHKLDGDGFYLEPTVVEVEDPATPLAREEVLAPATALLRASSAEEAVWIANGVSHGLVAAVFTEDLKKAIELGRKLEVGMVRVNASTSQLDYHVPYGGSNGSSLGSNQQGFAARDFYTETKTILISP